MKSDNKLISVFSTLTDPRSHINRLHSLNDILLIGIVSVICGAETWKQMIQFAKSKEDFFRKFLPFNKWITLGRHHKQSVFKY